MKSDELQQIIDNFRNNIDELHVILVGLHHAIESHAGLLQNTHANDDLISLGKELVKLDSQLKELKTSEADINLTEFLLKTGVNPENMKINRTENFKDYTLRMKNKSDVMLRKINSPTGLKSEVEQLKQTQKVNPSSPRMR